MPKLIDVTNTLGLTVLLARLAISPASLATSANRTDSSVRRSGLDGQPLRGRSGGDREAQHEQRADDLRGLGHRDREHDEEHEPQRPACGTPRAAATSGSTEANSSGR